MPRTLYESLDWLVAYDGETGRHAYLKGGDLVVDDDRIAFAGFGYDGHADAVRSGAGLMAMPGLIDLHSHPMSEGMNRGFSEDAGNPKLGMSGLYDYMPVYGPAPEDMADCAEQVYAELALSGVTSLVDLSIPYPGWEALAEKSGLRVWFSPMHRSARWRSPDGHSVHYDWAEDGGEESFRAALEIVDRAINQRSPLLSGIVTPAQIDTCTPELLKKSRDAAAERGVPLQIHAAQSLVEFAEITRRHGLTPVQWLDSLGLLDARLILAHGIFLDHHSWITWGSKRDLALMGDAGISLAHCPTVFLRHGMLLEYFKKYRDAGVTLGIGTDTFPHNMLEEVRQASQLARIPSRHVEGASTTDVFEAATLGGARALGRDDIGRLAAGSRADFVLVDCTHPAMRPVRDPLRSLIHSAADRAIREVHVAGQAIVRDGKVLTLDYAESAAKVDAAARRAEARVPELDWGGKSGREKSPLTLPEHTRT